MVRIRLTRIGRKNLPAYRIAVFDGRAPRNGAYLEKLGHYNPRAKDPKAKVTLNRERYEFWIRRGAQPSESLVRILKHAGILTE